MALLGLTFCATGLATLCAIAMACGMVNHRLAARAPRRLGGWVAGSVFLAMGVGLGLARRAH
jgi:threonine/homoserine/homoserine lactone efflux protein